MFANFFWPFLALKLIHLLPPVLPKIFAFFSIKIDSLTTSYFAQIFAFFSIEIDSLTLKVMIPPYFAQIVCHS